MIIGLTKKKAWIIGFIYQIATLFNIVPGVIAQNLVPNPGFEEIEDCQLYFDQLQKAKGWKGYRFTPDLFHACSESPLVQVPHNTFDPQRAAEGSAYAGFLSYHRDFEQELLGIRLKSALIPGRWYKVSFQVSRAAQHARYASNNLGLVFTDQPEKTYQSGLAHVWAEEIVEASETWHLIEGYYQAEEPYTYAVVGNFFSPDQTQLKRMEEGAFEAAYYFLDDIQVELLPPGVNPPSRPKKTSLPSAAKQSEKPPSGNPQIKGRILDADTKSPLVAQVSLIVPHTSYREDLETDYVSGKYHFKEIPQPDSLRLQIRARNYFPVHQEFKPRKGEIIEQDFFLKMLRAGQEIRLRQVEFEADNQTIQPPSFGELNRLIRAMKDNPTMRIEIAAYTDDEREMGEAKQRAEAIRNYLIEVGEIDPGRIRIDSYLEIPPRRLVGDEAEDQDPIERIEFKILN